MFATTVAVSGFSKLELTADDSATDWWILAAQAEFGMEVEKTRDWWVE